MVQSSLVLVLVLTLILAATLFYTLRQRVGVRQESVEAQLAWYQRQLQAGRISLAQYQAIRRELTR
ncbi:hypothetical protein [Lacticaseibacillus jixiensis]|uniref:hypothetical protein n=1 Tax=Lacticaseibacillus jixiensis TaxID=3231926 RepID=UPI0036F2187A